MLYALVMFLAYQAINALLVLKVDISEDWIALDQLVQDIEIEWQLIH